MVSLSFPARLFACFITAFIPSATLADTPGEFDFYVLSLSWSPTYCKQRGSDANPHQCSLSDPFGFIVHGLWPQHETGYPQNCEGVPQRIDRGIAVEMEDIMPGHGLVFHQWRKHGSCSGLKPADYFKLTRMAFDTINVPSDFKSPGEKDDISPEAIETAFRLANPGLKENALAVTCSSGELVEIRICMTKDLKFRSCPEIDRRGCRAGNISIPPLKTR